jgi:hypothetical protein
MNEADQLPKEEVLSDKLLNAYARIKLKAERINKRCTRVSYPRSWMDGSMGRAGAVVPLPWWMEVTVGEFA